MESGGHGTDPRDERDDPFGTLSTGRLLSRVDVPAFNLTAAGELVAVNDPFCALTGYGREALVGRSLSVLLATDPETALPDERPGSTATAQAVSLETADGDLLTCDVHAQRLASPDDGDPAYAAVVEPTEDGTPPSSAGSDITYGRIFGALAEAVTDGIIVLNADSEVQYANPAVERILGYAPSELVGGSKVEIIPERLRQVHLDALARYLETGEKNIDWSYVELPGQHRDGHEVPLGISLNDFDYDGERFFVGLFRDISTRKAVEQTLSEKASQLESVADVGRHALASTDLDALFATATELVADSLDAEYAAVCELDGRGRELTPRAAVGWEPGTSETAAVPATETESQPGYALAVDHSVVVEDVEAETRFDRSARSRDHGVQSGVSVVIGPPDDPWGTLGVYDTGTREFADHDVNFVESAATMLATAIERRRRERELNDTVAKLEDSNERLEQFAYATSHDLQEPLRMVSSYLQLIERRYADELDDEGREFIDFAVDGADRMREMIHALLAYSRVDTRGMSFTEVDLEIVLDDVRTDLRVAIDESDAEVTVEALPTVYGDPRQLHQVFQNLLSNAVEYSDGAPRVVVAAERTGERWRVDVTDEGIGIDPADTDRIFDVFQRLHSRGEHAGTGIGLALVQRIVERHGGDIWVDSVPSEGSTFSVTLPAAASTEE